MLESYLKIIKCFISMKINIEKAFKQDINLLIQKRTKNQLILSEIDAL